MRTYIRDNLSYLTADELYKDKNNELPDLLNLCIQIVIVSVHNEYYR